MEVQDLLLLPESCGLFLPSLELFQSVFCFVAAVMH